MRSSIPLLLICNTICGDWEAFFPFYFLLCVYYSIANPSWGMVERDGRRRPPEIARLQATSPVSLLSTAVYEETDKCQFQFKSI